MTSPRGIDPVAGERARVERASRMVEVWRQDEPTASDVAAARARLRLHDGRRARSRVLPVVIAFAVVLGGAGALASVKVMSQRAQHGSRVSEAPALTTEGVVPLSVTPHASVEALPLVAPAASAVDAEPVVAPSTPNEPLHSTPRAAPRIASAPSARWSAAADAMRAGDYASAERAFDDLARSPDARTRDEARLARAQVLVAGGRPDEARAELESLARAGATPLVRDRAAEALRALSARPLTAPASGN